MTADPFLKLSEVASLTDTKEATLRRWVRTGCLPVERIGPLKLKRIRVRLSVVVQYFPESEKLYRLRHSVPLTVPPSV